MEDKILEILVELKESQTRLENQIGNLELGQQETNKRLTNIESDIKDIKIDIGSIKINIKETREDAESSELAIAQNSLDIAKIKMRMKMA